MIPGNKDTRDGIIFSLPFLVVYLAFMIYPLLSGLYISFFKWDILSTASFVGLDNYRTLFSDEKFYSSLWHTLQFVLMTTPTLLVAGFLMALAITGSSPWKGLMENVFFFPYIFSMTVVSTLWAWLMQKDWGIFNQVLINIGQNPVSWLTNERLAMWSVALTTLWWTAGFNMVLFGAGIKQIPKEIYESAAIDGATYIQSVRHITIPLVSSTTVLCLILQIIASFNVFGQVYVMTGGGPHGTTRVLVQYIYETGFKFFKMGYSAAMSYILFLIILVVSILQYTLLGRKENA
ncbi:MAG: sugar ABC transporter permease [Sphaerochaeta sp.]|jgi:multiple sugar transport system permease protein|uniref:carbohydrate ABC transporter permease n=1 Tax=Sphaerochaeta sp. TaxID=1972642 RepID=UPI001DE55714|nr:sugar ABC transporter permease [uncultured Sphaerochaeta sp.]MDD3057839.1 sugar ABC transporter permease [Sphaerochaeta sp.]MDD3929035.1 sugar ABC transporter permease [Sphaerochaeta sp.]NCC12658.1 sugar ABC transporter permease [Spirochaetia bacterium]NCC88768.1 sugar ABC transporter permease [Spirochaetia bacterium]